MNFIDYRDTRPIFKQIADHFKDEILKGAMKEDDQLPSVRTLAMELATNPNTVQKAYASLEREGFCYSVRGRGSFVCDNSLLLDERRELLKRKLSELLAEADAIGLDLEEALRELR